VQTPSYSVMRYGYLFFCVLASFDCAYDMDHVSEIKCYYYHFLLVKTYHYAVGHFGTLLLLYSLFC